MTAKAAVPAPAKPAAKPAAKPKAPAPAPQGKGPNGATAKCKDNTYSTSKQRAGTCAGHGGVAQWY